MIVINHLRIGSPSGRWYVRALAYLVPLLGLVSCGGGGSPEIEPGNVLVKFRTVVDSAGRSKALRAAGVEETAQFGLVPGLTLATIPAGQTVEAAVEALWADPTVLYAEPDYVLNTAIVPNDASFSFLYALNNQGQTDGTNDADIDAPEAWDLETGNNVTIAVIDTGVDYTHEDLQANIWSNAGEIAGNGIDDDNNGYIDDVRGWDFRDDDNDPMDLNRHGTHVAGIIGAAGNNGIGVTGVNWAARIMPLKFMDAQGRGTTSAAIRALDYAVRNGARVSNNSWGGGAFSRALYDAISAANADGHLFVAAAGNDGLDADATAHYPSGYDLNNIVSVAASDDTDSLATFSNFGRISVDLAAPGVAILSTLPGDQYRSMSGTSMAAPFVTGVAAQILARNPNVSVGAVRSALLNGVDTKAGLAGRTATGGRLNAFKALSGIAGGTAGPAPVTPPPVATSPLSASPASADLLVNDTLQLNAGGGRTPYTWTSSNTNVIAVSRTAGLLSALAAGTATVTLSDANGTTVSVPVTVSANVVRTVQVTSPRASLLVNESIGLTASGGTPPYQWSVSDANVAAVSATGVLTGLASGVVRVSARDAAGNTGTSASLQVTAPATGGGGLEVVLNANSVTTFNTISVTVNGGITPYVWSLSNTAAGSLFADRTRPNVAWFTAGPTVGVTTTIIVTDNGGSRGQSSSVNIIPVTR